MHILLQDVELNTRRRVNTISDDEVDHLPPVLAAAQRLRDAKGKEQAFRESLAPQREAVRAVEKRISILREEARAIEAARLALCIRIAKGAADDGDDRNAQATLHDLNRQRDVLERAMPGLQQELAQAQAGVEGRARATSDAEDALETARIAAKLNIAKEN